jgi:predicted peptidase
MMQQAYTDGPLPYLLYLPEAAQGLVLFLHGRGERGTDLMRVKKWGLPGWLDNAGQAGTLPAPPYAVVSPQCPDDAAWTTEWVARETMALLDRMIDRHGIQADRVTVTGFSMGGQGAWYLAAETPERFAGVLPVAAVFPDAPRFTERLCRLADKPVWAVHSRSDEAVPVTHTRRAIEVLRACGGRPRYSEYADHDHGQTAAIAYQDAAILRWLAMPQQA